MRRLTRKGVDFVWDEWCQEAFEKLKAILGRDIVLKKLNYGPEGGQIKLEVPYSGTRGER